MAIIELNNLLDNPNGFSHGFFSRFNTPETKVPDSVVYCSNWYYFKKALSNDNVSAIVTSTDIIQQIEIPKNKTIFLSPNPYFDFWKLFNRMVQDGDIRISMKYGVHPSCIIHPTSVLSEKVFLGKNVIVQANAVVGDYTILGDNVEIGPGVIVGAEGLQVAVMGSETIYIRHAGGVSIGRNSKVLANSVIARGLFPEWTEIGENTFIALLVSIGHQAKIGSMCQISSNVVVGGSSIIGNGVSVGPSSTISSSIKIGAGAKIRLGSVVIKDVDPGTEVSGNFARSHLANIKSYLSHT